MNPSMRPDGVPVPPGTGTKGPKGDAATALEDKDVQSTPPGSGTKVPAGKGEEAVRPSKAVQPTPPDTPTKGPKGA